MSARLMVRPCRSAFTLYHQLPPGTLLDFSIDNSFWCQALGLVIARLWVKIRSKMVQVESLGDPEDCASIQ